MAMMVQTRLEMMTGCALDSGLWNEGMTPGGGGAAKITSRVATDGSSSSLEDVITADVGMLTHRRHPAETDTLTVPGRVVLCSDICAHIAHA